MKNLARIKPRAAYVRRIESVLENASPQEHAEGLAWYATANALAHTLADKHSITVRSAAGIIAALSPGISWQVNQDAARSLCAQDKKPHGGPYRANTAKAKRILNGEDPSAVLGQSTKTGKKVRAFFACILAPEASKTVCIDRHAFAIATGTTNEEVLAKVLRRVGVYEALEASYAAVAARHGFQPHQVQAITWVAWRNRKRGFDGNTLFFTPNTGA